MCIFKYEINKTGESDIIFGYNGKYGVITEPNGLVYMRARYYSPELRRFINADVIAGEISNAITLNRYAYANGNPVSNIDPFGLSAERGGVEEEKWYEKLYSDVKDAYHTVKDGIVSVYDWLVNEFKKLTQDGVLDPAILAAIGAFKDEKGVYHIKQDYWQSWEFVGYNSLYDWFFDIGVGTTGGTVEYMNFPFIGADGKKYTIWVWKGDYINLGAGAEAGIYKESGIPGHWLTSTENAMPMTLDLKEDRSRRTIFRYSPSEDNWWITGFFPLGAGHTVQASELEATITIDFSDNENLYEGFYKEYGSVDDSPWSFDGKVATLIW